MNARLPRGILTISIDLEVEAARPGRAAERSLEEVTFWLLEVLSKYQLPATWAVADPVASVAGERILSLGAGHEIAVLGESTWIGHEVGRSHFGRELARRTVRGRGGPAISTLVLKSGELGDHCDLAIKQGLTAVRHAAGAHRGKSARLQPQTLHYGLWSFPVSLTLPGASRWLPGGGGLRAARGGIERAIAGRGLFHLAIDAAQLVRRKNPAQRLLQRVLEHAERRRRQGVLDVESLRCAAEKLSNREQSRPSRSILRPAA
jgi:hypothetical protein